MSTLFWLVVIIGSLFIGFKIFAGGVSAAANFVSDKPSRSGMGRVSLNDMDPYRYSDDQGYKLDSEGHAHYDQDR